MNRKFAKPKADMTPEYLPDALIIDGRTILMPKAVHAAKAGYLPLSYAVPVDPPQGKHYEQQATIEPNGANGYRWQYALVDDPPAPPRRWTRLDILAAMGESNILEEAQAYLSSIEVKPKLNGWIALLGCNYIEEGFPTAERWNALLDGAARALGKTREEIDQFLAAIPTEGA